MATSNPSTQHTMKSKLTLIFLDEGEIDYTGVPLQTAHLAVYEQDADTPETLCGTLLTDPSYRYAPSYAAHSILVCNRCTALRKSRPYQKLGKPKKQERPNWFGYTHSSGRTSTVILTRTRTPIDEARRAADRVTDKVCTQPNVAWRGVRLGSKIIC